MLPLDEDLNRFGLVLLQQLEGLDVVLELPFKLDLGLVLIVPLKQLLLILSIHAEKLW